MTKAINNHCPVHTKEWLYYDTLEKEGYCIICKEWYELDKEV